MNVTSLLLKALDFEFLNEDEGFFLYENVSLAEISAVAHEIRKKIVPHNNVTWLIDRNINITNVCYSQCRFCNFCRTSSSSEAYITTIDEYRKKITELFEIGGNQLLIQGGMHPELGLSFYVSLFTWLKNEFPTLKLHALGPPEIVHLSKLEKANYSEVLSALISAGLDSLPGAGAEILDDRVRKIVSPAKCTTNEWLGVMEEAHKLGIITSATMMFGHVETRRERIRHLLKIRDLQAKKPANVPGFISFIPWTFQESGTKLHDNYGITNNVSASEYIRTIAMSRIVLPNIVNLQPSWLTVGKETAQICLHAGAYDFGSVMIEEHVVSAAGASNTFDVEGIQKAIREAGFEPKQRNQKYEFVN